eukprot:scpid20296/ scgid11402/ Lamin-C; pG-IF
MADESVSLSGSEADEVLVTETQSPGKHSRLHEREQLQELNGRLALFMDRIQCVRDQNDDLRGDLERGKETHRREMETHRSLFERELSEARKLLDETAREKARFELAASRNSSLASDAKTRLDEEAESRSKLERLLGDSERELQKSRQHFGDLLKEQTKLEEKVKQLSSDSDAFQEQAESARTNLESEMVARVNAQNNCQSLHEEIAFTLSVHNQEKEDLHSRLMNLEKEYSALKGSFEKELEQRVALSLAIGRDEQEKESDRIRAELDQLYMSKLKDATDRHDRDIASLNKLAESNLDLSNKNYQLNEENAALSAKIAQLSKQLDNREYERLRDREHYRVENERLQKELEVLQRELSSKLTEFADLMDVNIRLDKEISRYHRLLHEQEKKVGLDGSLYLRSAPTSAQKASTYSTSSPFGRPPPPPISTLPPRCSSADLQQPPPLPPRRTSASEDSGDEAAANAETGAPLMSASSLVSFLTGIGRKRRRATGHTASDPNNDECASTEHDGSSAGKPSLPPIEIEVCSQGHFVKLKSNSTEEIPLAGWRLERRLEKKTLVYRFSKNAVLQSNLPVTVWSSGAGPMQRTASDYVSRHVTSWGDNAQYPVNAIDFESVVRASTAGVDAALKQDASPTASPSKKRCQNRASTPMDSVTTTSGGADAVGLNSFAESARSDRMSVSEDEAASASVAQTVTVDTESVSEESTSHRHRVTRSATKNSKGSSKVARLRARSKSPGRRILAKSLSTVAAAAAAASSSVAAASASVETVSENESNADTQSSNEGTVDDSSSAKYSQRSSAGSTTLSAAFSVRRKVQSSSSTSNITTSSVDVKGISTSQSTTHASVSEAARHVSAFSNEELFHDQGDPGKENCVIC